jgi:hypothetical protein
MRSQDWSKYVLWTVYLALLGVLLPHTAWTFGQFEQEGQQWIGVVAAIAFEGAIAAFTWRLAQRIEDTPHYKKDASLRRFRFRYLNIYSLGLVVAIMASSLANWAHSVQFGGTFTIFEKYGIPPLLYTIAFGAILPACSLLFARILAEVSDSESEVDVELTTARDEIKDLKRQLKDSERRAEIAEGAARFLLELTAEDKARRILAAHGRWPELSQKSLALISESSEAYVSQVLKGEKANGTGVAHRPEQ